MKFFETLSEKLRRYDDGHNFTCDLCGREVFGGERICAQCDGSLPHNDKEICPLCGRQVREAGICLECKEKPLSLAAARSAFTHDGDAARLISRFKDGQKYLYRTLCDYLEPLLSQFTGADALTFVPMTETAERRRGYNQSRLLAEELSRRSGWELLDVAEKKRETLSQKTLSRREREENLKGCFHLKQRAVLRGRRIVIVDDTMTTGATADELSSAFLRAGADAVFLLTVTSVTRKEPFGKPPEQQK